MKEKTQWPERILALVLILMIGSYIGFCQASPARHAPQVRMLPTHDLPQLDGQHLRVSVVEVIYKPGGYSKPHSHACPVIGYVAEGALRTQVKGEPEKIYNVGESFYEPPNGVHL